MENENRVREQRGTIDDSLVNLGESTLPALLVGFITEPSMPSPPISEDATPEEKAAAHKRNEARRVRRFCLKIGVIGIILATMGYLFGEVVCRIIHGNEQC